MTIWISFSFMVTRLNFNIEIWAASWQNQHNGFATSMDPDQPAQSDQDPCRLLTNHITRQETDTEQHGSWSDCADAQAGLDPCWSVGFVMTQIICFNDYDKSIESMFPASKSKVRIIIPLEKWSYCSSIYSKIVKIPLSISIFGVYPLSPYLEVPFSTYQQI
jgi:hypothetical protein